MLKRKNDDEKPKRRPRAWMIFVALGLMVIGVVGILQGLSRSAAPVLTATPLMSYHQVTVNSYSMETTYTIQTSNGMTTTTIQDDELLAQFAPTLMSAMNAAVEGLIPTPIP